MGVGRLGSQPQKMTDTGAAWALGAGSKAPSGLWAPTVLPCSGSSPGNPTDTAWALFSPLGWGSLTGSPTKTHMMTRVGHGTFPKGTQEMAFPEEEGMDTGFSTQNVHYTIFQMKELRHGVVKNMCPNPQGREVAKWTPFCPDPVWIQSP